MVAPPTNTGLRRATGVRAPCAPPARQYENFRSLLLCRILVGERERGRACHDPSRSCQSRRLLIDHAIDGVGKPVARFSHLRYRRAAPRRLGTTSRLPRHAKPSSDEPFKRLRMPAQRAFEAWAGWRRPKNLSGRVALTREIELAQRTGGALRGLTIPFLQLALRALRRRSRAVHQDLAAQLELARIRGLSQAQRNRAQCRRLGVTILACSAVAARGSLGEQALAVGRLIARPSNFGSAAYRPRRLERLGTRPIEGAEPLPRRKRWRSTASECDAGLGELGQRRPAHPWVGESGALVRDASLPAQEFLKQPVIYRRLRSPVVLDVVEPVMVLEDFPETLASLPIFLGTL